MIKTWIQTVPAAYLIPVLLPVLLYVHVPVVLAFPVGVEAPVETLLAYQSLARNERIAPVAGTDVETKLKKTKSMTTHTDVVGGAAAEVEVDAGSDVDVDVGGEAMQSDGIGQEINAARPAAAAQGINNDVHVHVHVADVIVIVDDGGGESVSEDVSDGEGEDVNEDAGDEGEGEHRNELLPAVAARGAGEVRVEQQVNVEPPRAVLL